MNRRLLAAGVVGVSLLGSALPAHATTNLAWTWDETPRRYVIRANIHPPEVMYFNLENSVDVRVTEFAIALDTKCKAVGDYKKTWALECSIDDIQLEASSFDSSDERVLKVLDQWDEKYLHSTVQIEFGKDGRVRDVDLEGVDTRNNRNRIIAESMRLTMVRLFAALESPMPKKGDDGGKPWKQKESLVLVLPMATGTVGSIQLLREVTATEGSVATIDTVGHAIVSNGQSVSVGGGDRLANLYELNYRGRATFDTEAGMLLSNTYLADGGPTASSIVAEGISGVVYVQGVELEYVPPGTAVPMLGPNRAKEASQGTAPQ